MITIELNDYEAEQIRLIRMDPEVRRVEMLLRQKASIEETLASEKCQNILADETKIMAMSDDVKNIITNNTVITTTKIK
jgi:hypothetical protein